MPPIRTTDDKNGRPRQDPVSCQLCRLKKLKCDRQRPCSNCQSRRVSCEYKGDAPRLQHDDPDLTSSIDLRNENEAIKARLRRLEATVFGDAPPNAADLNRPRASTAASTPVKSRIEDDKADEDSTWLETVGTLSETVLPQFAFPLIVNIWSLDQFLDAEDRPSLTREINIPGYEIAMESLSAYAEYMDATQHVMRKSNSHWALD